MFVSGTYDNKNVRQAVDQSLSHIPYQPDVHCHPLLFLMGILVSFYSPLFYTIPFSAMIFFGKIIWVTSPLPMRPFSLYACTSVTTFPCSCSMSVAIRVTVEPSGEGLICLMVTAPPIPSSSLSKNGNMIFRDTHSM